MSMSESEREDRKLDIIECVRRLGRRSLIEANKVMKGSSY
jgi:hypothetical protein